MQSLHAVAAVDVAFDEANLVADAGLVPVVALAEQVGLPKLVTEHVKIVDAENAAGANPAAKVMSLLAGMVAGADSIEDIDRLRRAGSRLLFDQIRAPSTLGTFLRAFSHRHVQQLNAVLRRMLIVLAARVELLPGAEAVVFVDLDSTHQTARTPGVAGGVGQVAQLVSQLDAGQPAGHGADPGAVPGELGEVAGDGAGGRGQRRQPPSCAPGGELAPIGPVAAQGVGRFDDGSSHWKGARVMILGHAGTLLPPSSAEAPQAP